MLHSTPPAEVNFVTPVSQIVCDLVTPVSQIVCVRDLVTPVSQIVCVTLLHLCVKECV